MSEEQQPIEDDRIDGEDYDYDPELDDDTFDDDDEDFEDVTG